MISGVIVTKNSEQEIGDCLASLNDFCQEIIVVDLESSDKTIDIAKKFKAKIFEHEPVQYVELVRQFAISLASGDWIVMLDPDERLSGELKEKLLEISLQKDVAAVNIPRKNIFFGSWVKHTNFWPDRQVRFFKAGKIVWNKRIHSYPQISGKMIDLDANGKFVILHYGFSDYAEFFDRHNRYSSVEAENLYSAGQRFSIINLIWKPMREILVRYIKHFGFLDGFLGLSLVYSLAIYQLMVQIKLWEKGKRLA